MNVERLGQYSKIEALEHKIQIVEDIIETFSYAFSNKEAINESILKYHLLIEEARTILKSGNNELDSVYLKFQAITNEIRDLTGIAEDFY